jgi:hypothetical protein
LAHSEGVLALAFARNRRWYRRQLLVAQVLDELRATDRGDLVDRRHRVAGTDVSRIDLPRVTGNLEADVSFVPVLLAPP